MHTDGPEAFENNNVFNLTIRWCGWGSELSAGSNISIGQHIDAPWGSVLCITDEDIIKVRPCSARGSTD